MVFKWNDKDTLLFLKYFKKYQCLWNHRLDEYKDRTMRANAINSLISDMKLEITGTDIKHKIKTIRTRYTTELAKIKQSTKTGCSSDDIYEYIPSLYWFKHAEFLKSVCVPRQSASNLNVAINTKKKELISQDSSSTSEQNNSQDACDEQKAPNLLMKPIKRKRKNDMVNDRAVKESKSVSEQTKVEPEHEFDLFCKSLAIQLKNMPLNRALICQEKLQSVMVKERLSQIYSIPQPELVYSESSSQSPYSVNQSPQYGNASPH